ncbi:MAG: 2,3-epoxybenzoyl-CoA dihydrolase [Myxococcota bacterium]
MAGETPLDFRTHPKAYRHWRLEVVGERADLTLDVDETGGLRSEDYALKLNSYDISVDIELRDAVERLRFEHPGVKVVVLRSAQEKVFCAGANIRMLASSSHAHKVNFCKLTNETRNAIEESGRLAGQYYLAAVNGACAGGGYELALAADEILLVDDGSSAVSLPEVPLLAVLPGTGGLTRVIDKRRVRKDRADVFCTTEEGVKGQRAVDWGLVDSVAAPSDFDSAVDARVAALSARSDRDGEAQGIVLAALERTATGRNLRYPALQMDVESEGRWATLRSFGPERAPPASPRALVDEGHENWFLQWSRALDDALLHLRFNEPEVGLLLLETQGDPELLLAHDAFLAAHADHWLVREIRLQVARTLRRLELTSRSLFALAPPGSAFAGTFAELAWAADRFYMGDGVFEDVDAPASQLRISEASFGYYPTTNGETRLQARFRGESSAVGRAREHLEKPLEADAARDLGLVTATFDDIDWEDELRVLIEERASFSPDALTGLEANLRFGGPESLASKIFGRLTAWQNWIFQRPNAVGAEGALRKYGSGQRARFDKARV